MKEKDKKLLRRDQPWQRTPKTLKQFHIRSPKIPNSANSWVALLKSLKCFKTTKKTDYIHHNWVFFFCCNHHNWINWPFFFSSPFFALATSIAFDLNITLSTVDYKTSCTHQQGENRLFFLFIVVIMLIKKKRITWEITIFKTYFISRKFKNLSHQKCL